jgi:cell division septum initiation protein DivIVA
LKFDIEKKGYKKSQVDEYVFALKGEYETKLNDQKNRIFALRAEVAEKEKQLQAYREKVDLVSSAIIHAVAKADEIEKTALARYREEIDALRVFHEKWQAHYDKLLAKYPDDATLKAQSKFNAELDEILTSSDDNFESLNAQFNSESERVGHHYVDIFDMNKSYTEYINEVR